MLGGEPGKPGQVTIYKAGSTKGQTIYKTDNLKLDAGDIVCIETGGGGGYGLAAERDKALAERDTARGYVTDPLALPR